MATEPVPVSHTLRRRLESLQHRKALAERSEATPRVHALQLPPGTACGPGFLKPLGDGARDPFTPRMAKPLTPSGTAAFLAGAMNPRYPLLVDCRGLGMGAVRDLWQSWPESVTAAEVASVLIVDDPDCLVLAGDGACMELVPLADQASSAAEAFAARSRLDFVMAKYGADRIVKAELYFGS